MNTKRQRDSSKQNIKQFLTTSAHYQEVNPTNVKHEIQYLRDQEQKNYRCQIRNSDGLASNFSQENLRASICQPCHHSASIQCHNVTRQSTEE